MSRFAHHTRTHGHDPAYAHLEYRFIVVPALLWAAALLAAVISTLLQPPPASDTAGQPPAALSIADHVVGA
ncbi:MAG: hypothetical protein U1F56_20535 [Rubrivivax sp.]